MTGEQREQIRTLYDAHIRHKVIDSAPSDRKCVNCGTLHELKTPGCSTCWSRHRMREPDKHEYNRERMRRRRARLRAQVA